MIEVEDEVIQYRHQAHYIAEVLATLGRLQRLVHSQRPKGVKRRVLPVSPIARQSGSHRLPRSLHRKRYQQVVQPEAATDPVLSFDPLEVERQVTEYSRPSVRFFTDSSSATAAAAGSVFVGRQSGGKLPLIGNRAGRSLTGEPTHSTSTAIGSMLKVGRQCDGYLPLV